MQMPQARKRLTLPVCRPAPGADTPLSIADVTPTLTERIIATVGVSDVPNLIWSDRGLAPSGYAKGMAVAFARVYAKWKIRNSAALVMAAANSGDDTRDALLGIIRGSSRRPWTTARLAPTRCAISSCYCSGLACAKAADAIARAVTARHEISTPIWRKPDCSR